jgi:hypothetical protein
MPPSTPFYAADGLHVEVYDRLHETTIPGSSVDGDAAWFTARALEWGGPVLEGASGTGRVSWELARAGVEVVGFDLSPAMIRAAEAKRAGMDPAVAARATFVPGDLRTFDLGRTFPLAIVPFRAFQALLTPEDQAACLGRFLAHLAPGGRLVLDLFDPRYEYLVSENPPMALEEDSIPHPARDSTVTVTMERQEFDPVRQVFRDRWTFRERDPSGGVIREEAEDLTLRWSFRWEMRHLFDLCGLEVEAEYSDFRDSPPEYGREQVWVLRRGQYGT